MPPISTRYVTASANALEGEVNPRYPARAGQPGCRRSPGSLLSDGADQAALGFIEALEQAYAHIGRHPASGSPRYAHELNLPGLRFRPLSRYPHLVFYLERADRIDVWRVLHGQRDIPAWMQESDAR